MVVPVFGALNQTSSEPEVGGGVEVPLDGGDAAFWMLTLISSMREAPLDVYATARRRCVPLANFVVSSTHCMPSLMVVSVLSAVLSRKNWTRATPEPAT